MNEITRKKHTGEPGNGGEFGHRVNHNSDTGLGGIQQDFGDTDTDADWDSTDWGSVENVQEGSRTPWGTADNVYHTAPGIVQAGTPGHGGVKLSPERNRQIPTALRNASGWYEEDCESNIVGMVYPEAFPDFTAKMEQDEAFDYFESRVKEWFPIQYEAATGTKIPFGESAEKDSDDYYADKQGQTLLYTTHAKEDPDFPGYVNVTTCIHGENTFTKHLVPLDSYTAAQGFKHGAAKVNAPLPAGSIDITPPADPPKPPSPRYKGIDTSGLTENQRWRADNELNKRWRDTSGRIYTLRENIERGDITGKTVHSGSGKATYVLYSSDVPEGQSGGTNTYVTQVSKAVWDAVEAPDDRSESDRLSLASDQADNAYHRARQEWKSSSAIEKARKRRDKTLEAYRIVSDQEREISRTNYERTNAEKERVALETARSAYAAATKS